MRTRTGERFAAACGALYVGLLVVGDDFINPAGEPPEADAPLRELSAYLGKADAAGFWLGRSIGLLALCALLVFVVHLSRTIRDAEGEAGALSGLVLAGGTVVVALQFLAAPAQFAAVQGAADGLDPRVSQALLHASISFQLSFFPLAVLLGTVGVAGLRFALLPRWLAVAAALVAIGLAGGMVGHPEEPSPIPHMAFALCLLWLVAVSVVLVRRVGLAATPRRAVPTRATPVAGALVALALAAGVAACGDDEDDKGALSKSDYVARSGVICTSSGKQAGEDYERIVENSPRTAHTAQRFLSESVVPLFRQSVAKREEVPAPEGDEQEIEAMMASGKKALAGFERAAARPSEALALMQGKVPDPAMDFDARSRRYGIAKCGGD